MNFDLRIIAFLLSLAAAAFALILGVSVGSGEYLMPTLVIVAFAAIFLISKPQVAVAGAIATFFSGVTLPGLPGQMKLFDVFALALIGIFILSATLRKAGRKQIPFSKLDWVVLAFCAWILFVGFVRGLGFLAFGGDKIGGFLYIRLLLAASLVITLPRIGLPPGNWRSVILIAGLLAPASLIADLLVMKGWGFTLVRTFVQTGQSEDVLETAEDSDPAGMNRLFSAGLAANGMLLALLCLVPMRKFFRPGGIFWVTLFASIFALSLLSGFRMMTFSLVAIAALALYFQKGFTAPRMATLFIAGCAGLLFVYLFASHLPNSAQRAISWLPGIQVSNIAMGDATQTVEWRLQVWHEALRYVPDYWLIGKGFSYDKLDYIYALQSLDTTRWALVTGSYHNGWLSMLLCTGVVGTILCLILLVAPMILHWKRQRANWNNPFFQHIHGVFLAALVTTVAAFAVIYGEVHTSFPVLFFYWAMMEMLSRADADAEPASPSEYEPSETFESVYQET